MRWWRRAERRAERARELHPSSFGPTRSGTDAETRAAVVDDPHRAALERAFENGGKDAELRLLLSLKYVDDADVKSVIERLLNERVRRLPGGPDHGRA